MTDERDPIMDEVYATRKAISARYGNDARRYCDALRDKVACAEREGVSFVDYCLALIANRKPVIA